MRVMFKGIGAALAGGLMMTGAAAHDGGGSGTLKYRATATYSDGSSADRLYAVWRDGDSDDDRPSDDTYLRVRCDNGAVAAVYSVRSPRDSATGQASGKRMHKPFTITKELGASSLIFGKTGGGKVKPSALSWDLVKGTGARMDHSGASEASAGQGAAGERATYDVKKNVGDKTMMQDDWHEVVLKEGAPTLCA